MRPSRSLPIVLLAILPVILEHRGVGAQVNDTVWKGFSVTCTNEEKSEVSNVSVSCHGIRLVRRIVQKLLEEARRKRSLEILDGVSLVERDDSEGTSQRGGRVLRAFGQMGSVMSFLENRELRIKLQSLLPGNLEAAIEKSLPSAEQARGGGGGGGGGGFGGGKKGDQGVMLMALMMGKTMAAMGFGALALLSMKALMVSSLALMLSLIVAAKKLAGGKDDGDSRTVVYAQEVVRPDHRRRRSLGVAPRDAPLANHPYRGHASGLPAEVRRAQ